MKTNAHIEAINKYKKELDLSTDLHYIVHLLTADIHEDDSEGYGNEARSRELSSALVGFEAKYGSDFMADFEDALNEMVGNFAERIVDGDYPNE